MYCHKRLLTASFITILLLSTSGYAKTIEVPAQFPTIQEAINNAQSGDEIKVAAGTYKENITLKNGISVLGKDAKTTTITNSINFDQPLVTTGGDCTISGFTVLGGDGGIKGSVYIPEGSPIISLNIIRDNHGSGIVAAPGASPTIRENLIFNNRSAGINLNTCAGHIIGNEIFKNFGNGISVQGSAPKIENNSIYQNGEAGIAVSYGVTRGVSVSARYEGEAEIIGNKIEDNKSAGLIAENTSPRVFNNTISNRGRPGLLLFGSGAIIKNNHLISSGPPAIHINPGSAPIIKNNKITGTRRFPILGDTSGATIKDNTIENRWQPKFFPK